MDKEISFSIASTKKRAWAFLIDDLVVSTFIIIIFFEQIQALIANVTVIDEIFILRVSAFILVHKWVILSIKVIYHGVLISQNGMTVGKYLMKIKVIDLETSQIPTLQKSFLRAIIRIPSESFLYLGFLLAYFTPLKQTLHDKLSNCVVVDV